MSSVSTEFAVRLRHDHITMSFFGTNGRGDSIVNGDYMEVFKKDYIKALFLVARIEDFDRSHAKLSFDALQPPAEKPVNPADFHRFSDLLKTLETPDKKPLHVFVLDFSGMKIDVSCHIMSLVQPGFLKYVGIRSSYETMDYHAIYKSMVEMEQWKMAKNLFVKEKFDFPLDGLFNAERVDLHRKGITSADLTRLKEFNNTMNLGFVVTLLNDIKPALVLIDRDGAGGVIKPQSQHHRLTLHDLRVHLQAALDDYEDFVRRGARVGEIAADETDVEDEAAGPSGCNAPSDDVDLDEPGPSNRRMAEYHDWPPPSQIKMDKKKSKEKQKKRKGPIQRAAPAQAQDNQSESSSTSRSRSPQSGQSVSNYEEQQPGTSEANDAALFNNTMNLGFVVTLLNDIKPALVLIDRDGAGGVIKPQSQHHRLTLHDLRVHLQAALDDYEDFVRRGARVGEIAADETDVEDEAAGPSGCNAPSDDVDLDEPGPSNRRMAEYHDWPPPSQIKMDKKKSKEKQKKRKGPIQRAAPAQAQDNQSESSSTSRSRSPQSGQSVSNYEEQQPGTSEANDAAPFNNTMNLGFVVTLLNDIKPALVLIDRDGAGGVIKPQSQHHRLTLHDLRVHLQAALDDYEDFVRRGARVGEIAADETDVEDEAAGPSGCNAPSDDVDLDEPGPSNRRMAEYHDWPPPSQIKMDKKKSKEKQKKRKGPIQRAAPAQAQDNQSESSSTSRSRSPQSGQSVSNYEEQQPGTSEANDAAPFNNTMNLGFVVTLLNDIKPALVLIDRDGAGGVIKPQSQHHRLTLHDLRVHLQAALDDYEDFVRRGARVGEIAADETDVEDEAAGPSGCNAPSDDVDLDEPGPSNRRMAEYHDWPPPSQIKMDKKKSKEKQKKRKGPIQRAAPAQAQDNQSESSSTSRSRSPQSGQSVSNYEEQQPGTSEANDAAPFNNTMNLGFVVTLLNDIKPPALVLIDRDGAGGVIDHRPLLISQLLDRIDNGLDFFSALDDYEDFVRRGARVGEIAADETDVEDEAAGPSGCNAPSDDVDLDEPGPSNRRMAEYHDWPPPSQIKMDKKKSKEKQKKRKGPIQRAAPAQAQDNQSESSSTSRSRSPQSGQSVSNYEEQQPGTSEANDAAPFNNTMNLGFVVTLLNDIKPALVLIDRDGAGGVIDHRPLLISQLLDRIDNGLDFFCS
ncbi:unnamed protein product [Caenorhabditis brenneri]